MSAGAAAAGGGAAEAVRVAGAGAGPEGATWWARAAARLDRARRWEFWPTWAVYVPLAPWYLMWAARYGPTAFTATNPCMPLGGMVGESKWDVLRRLPAGVAAPTIVLEPGPGPERLATLQEAARERGWTLPLIIKPDVGERGSGVRLARDWARAAEILAADQRRLLAQVFHPGPHEAGVFYVRPPGEARGFVFSITDKVLPAVVGDGRTPLADLIDADARLRLQAGVFLKRLGPRAAMVPAAGERVSLGVAGNHCQGTLFRDGAELITPALTAAIDAAAAAVPGFHFGRFDVRYADRAEFKAGRGLFVVEVNGVLSESTNIYDPRTGFWAGQRVLRAQWSWAYRIGAANVKAGDGRAAGVGEIFAALGAHRRSGVMGGGSD